MKWKLLAKLGDHALAGALGWWIGDRLEQGREEKAKRETGAMTPDPEFEVDGALPDALPDDPAIESSAVDEDSVDLLADEEWSSSELFSEADDSSESADLHLDLF